jgi:hypothetical protein
MRLVLAALLVTACHVSNSGSAVSPDGAAALADATGPLADDVAPPDVVLSALADGALPGPADSGDGALPIAAADAGRADTVLAGPALTADQVRQWAEAYRKAHPGNGGKDRDIIGCCDGASRTPAALAADSAAQQLRAICGMDQLPVIPLLAWEYGGGDHPWISPEASALVYCVHVPTRTPSPGWQYDPARRRVTADVRLLFPDQNPCRAKAGPAQVLDCLGDPSNLEILVDTASYHDGVDVGLALSEASTDLNLLLPDGSKVHLVTGL